ncbi:alpha/beta-Hydrolases superfamily protein [Euphorbia peplus]|nr:alpha/beta-Hydrolases superfamily protein [Euphorbia peplus]
MAELRGGGNTWTEELASLVDDTTGLLYGSPPAFSKYGGDAEEVRAESLKEQVTEFMKAWGEMLLDLGIGCKEILQQSFVTEDSFIVQKVGKPMAKVSDRFKFLNEFLPEDRDPAHAWPVIFFVCILALAAIGVNTTHESSVPQLKRMIVHPPSADRILLPDGRNMAYHDKGVPADRARYSLIAPHSFLSSRLAGIPGVKTSLLEEFGVRLITYDLPGFGESDPHSSRNLNSSAMDMLFLADALGVTGKFWILGYSSGSMHAWAALRFIPERIAGAAIVSPLINPYELSMTKDEKRRAWEQWSSKRRFMYFLARKFPSFLTSFYRRRFLSGFHGQIDKWMSQKLGRKDEIIIEEPRFKEFWYRDVEESIRQGSAKPFVEEAALHVSNWGFSLVDLQVQKKCSTKGFLLWLKSMYSGAECELAGFLGPIHVWQGMDDQVAPPAMTDYANILCSFRRCSRPASEGCGNR